MCHKTKQNKTEVLMLFSNKDGLGIIYPTKVDMLWNRETDNY